MGSISAPGGRFLLVGSVSVECNRLRQKSGFPRSVPVMQYAKSDISLGTRPREGLVAEGGRLRNHENETPWRYNSTLAALQSS